MLFKRTFLADLAAGKVTSTIRRWPSRPAARAGGRYRTEVGTVVVEGIERVSVAGLTDTDAQAAGYRHRTAMVTDLRAGEDEEVYRVGVRLAGDGEELPPRERIVLAAQADLSPADVDSIAERLARLDGRSPHGPWTAATLEQIAIRPATRAGDLAEALGRERLPFKADVRKLKALGLTESLETGYRLSPRGEAYHRARRRS